MLMPSLLICAMRTLPGRGNSAVQLRARYASVKLSGGLQCDHQAWLDVVISHVTLMCAATMKPRTLTVNIQYDAL